MKSPVPALAIWLILSLFHKTECRAQKWWDGGAGDGQWSSASNWQPDGIPAAGEDVILDNMFLAGSYTVAFPPGSSPVALHSLTIRPQAGDSIQLDIPNLNTAVPAISLSSTGDCLILDTGATLRNGSGAASGETILLQGSFVIHDGGHYVHRTPRANAYLIDHLSADSSTTHGIFEFDVPGAAGYTVSLTGNSFGQLRFSANAAGGTKSYSGSGTTSLNIRGGLLVGTGAQLTSTLTADLILGSDLSVQGALNLIPVTTGTTGRRLLFTGVGPHITGNGTLSLGTNFRGIEISAGASVMLEREIDLPFSSQTWWLRTDAILDLGDHIIRGQGAFQSEPNATLRIGHPDGITTMDAGNIRTATRQFDTAMTYVYAGDGPQSSGDALPSIIEGLVIEKKSGNLELSKPVETNRLRLVQGLVLTTDSTVIAIHGEILSPQDAYGRTDEGWDGSHVAGPCILRTTGPGTWHVPIGTATRFAPIALHRNGQGLISYTCGYHQGPVPMTMGMGVFASLDDREYWTVSASGSTPASDAFIDLSWRTVDWPQIDSSGAQALRIAAADNASPEHLWTGQGVPPSIEDLGGRGWVHAGLPSSSFGMFTLGTLMPMTLLATSGVLQCRAATDGNLLSWVAATPFGKEVQIECSDDGKIFRDLTMVRPMASSFVDERGMLQDRWYRLRFLQDDGRSMYSNTCLVKGTAMHHWSIFPQPAADHVCVQAPGMLRNVRYRILDPDGRILQEGRLPDADRFTISTGHMGTGVRVLQLFHAGGKFIRTMSFGQGK